MVGATACGVATADVEERGWCVLKSIAEQRGMHQEQGFPLRPQYISVAGRVLQYSPSVTSNKIIISRVYLCLLFVEFFCM